MDDLEQLILSHDSWVVTSKGISTHAHGVTRCLLFDEIAKALKIFENLIKQGFYSVKTLDGKDGKYLVIDKVYYCNNCYKINKTKSIMEKTTWGVYKCPKCGGFNHG